MKNTVRCFLAISLLLCWANPGFAAVAGGILPGDAAQTADADTLQAELSLFKSIREGITLSLAYCDKLKSCDPAASSGELEQIMTAIDQRIDALTQRQQDEDATPGLAELLIAYVSERESYSRFLDKLGADVEEGKTVGEDIDEAELFGDKEETKPAPEQQKAAGKAEDNVEKLDIFKDEGEDL